MNQSETSVFCESETIPLYWLSCFCTDSVSSRCGSCRSNSISWSHL